VDTKTSDNQHRTGNIWKKTPSKRSSVVRQVCKKLEQTYGKPRLGNPSEPLDDLVYIIVSNKTPPDRADKLYQALKSTYETWDDVLAKGFKKLERVLKPGGLVKAKAPQMWAALEKVRDDFGKCDLSILKGYSESEAFDYLVSLPGVSKKVAKCVMMYTLEMDVLPVDSHVHRVSKRLGWTDKKEPRQAHEELEALVPPELRYGFHVDCLVHGREICRPAQPKCPSCVIRKSCSYYLASFHSIR
jgi:endonuclease III